MRLILPVLIRVFLGGESAWSACEIRRWKAKEPNDLFVFLKFSVKISWDILIVKEDLLEMNRTCSCSPGQN